MEIRHKSFKQEHLHECDIIKYQAKKKFNLNPVNNIYLILHKLKELNNLEGHYVECGTFKGNTLIPAALYSSHTGFFREKKIIGIDTFEGFPPTTEHHEYDLPSYFTVLYNNNLINENHYHKAIKRTNNLLDLSHLESEYFLNVEEVFNNSSKFSNVSLLKGSFEEVTPNFDDKIAILHLDGDLYESYLTCLHNLYDNVVIGGAVIFDEYYSHKYPGARVAVNEFFADKTGYFEKYLTSEGHERWCFIKN
jgi:hypothetical protein